VIVCFVEKNDTKVYAQVNLRIVLVCRIWCINKLCALKFSAIKQLFWKRPVQSLLVL